MRSCHFYKWPCGNSFVVNNWPSSMTIIAAYYATINEILHFDDLQSRSSLLFRRRYVLEVVAARCTFPSHDSVRQRRAAKQHKCSCRARRGTIHVRRKKRKANCSRSLLSTELQAATPNDHSNYPAVHTLPPNGNENSWQPIN